LSFCQADLDGRLVNRAQAGARLAQWDEFGTDSLTPGENLDQVTLAHLDDAVRISERLSKGLNRTDRQGGLAQEKLDAVFD
jgi:hypothetical protein